MSEMTRERILEVKAGVARGAVDFNGTEFSELCDLALQVLTARSEGFREGVEAAAKVCDGKANEARAVWDAYTARCQENPDNIGAGSTSWHQIYEGCATAIRALSLRETDANVVGWVQEHKDGRKTFYAGDIDPREIHDNGMPTYQVYRLPPPPERP